MTTFYCFVNGKIKTESEKPWIRYKCSKKLAIPRFSAASSKFCSKWQIPQRGVKSASRRILLALVQFEKLHQWCRYAHTCDYGNSRVTGSVWCKCSTEPLTAAHWGDKAKQWTRKSCTGRSPVQSIGHARSCRCRVATWWKEQTRRSQNCKYLQ